MGPDWERRLFLALGQISKFLLGSGFGLKRRLGSGQPGPSLQYPHEVLVLCVRKDIYFGDMNISVVRES